MTNPSFNNFYVYLWLLFTKLSDFFNISVENITWKYQEFTSPKKGNHFKNWKLPSSFVLVRPSYLISFLEVNEKNFWTILPDYHA